MTQLWLPLDWYQIVTPLHADFWRRELASHQDNKFAAWVCSSIKQGFCIGFSQNEMELCSSRCNMLLAIEHPQVVTECIQGELASQHLLPVNMSSSQVSLAVHISLLEVILKKGSPTRWRLIMDLLASQRHSINNAITKELCSLHYSLVDKAAMKVAELGTSMLITKMDMHHTYRNIPVVPEDKPLLGVYVDQLHPFGLRSAPMIFSVIADALL